MNITLYTHYFHPEIGAPSARMYDLSRQWINRGHSVQAVTCFPNHPGGKIYPGYAKNKYYHEIIDRIHVHRHWTYITPNEGVLKKALGHISYLPSALLISNRNIDKPDIVVGTSPTLFAAQAASITGSRKRIPFIMEVRDLWPAIFVELGIITNKYLIRALERWEMRLYRKAAAIVTVTEAFRKNIIDRGIPSEKVFTIPNGADVDYWSPVEDTNELRNKLNVKDKFVVLYIGAHGISHALRKIIDSAEKLKDNENIQFLFVGDGAEKKQLMEYANSKSLGNIRFHEPVDKNTVKKFYSLADVCLVPLRNISLFNTFIPSKMFEIMAMEKPIIGSVRGESADILDKSNAALVVEPENCTEIAKAVRYLYENKSIGEEMGKNGREYVTNHYSRSALAERYMTVLTEAQKRYHKEYT